MKTLVRTQARALFILCALLIVLAGLSLVACNTNAGSTGSQNSQSGSALPPSSLSDIQITGKEGEEPSVVIPKNLVAHDDTTLLLRNGTGVDLSNQNEVTCRIQKIALDNPNTIYSSWGKNDEYGEFTFDLTDEMSEFLPAPLREVLLKAKVGAVIAIKVTGPRSKLEPDTYNSSGNNDSVGAFNEDEDSVEQVWIVTVVKIAQAAPMPNTPAK